MRSTYRPFKEHMATEHGIRVIEDNRGLPIASKMNLVFIADLAFHPKWGKKVRIEDVLDELLMFGNIC